MSGKPGNEHFTLGRPFKVFVAGLFSSFILVLGGLYAKSLNDPGQIYTLLATLAAAPPLFVVWMFRNEDKQKDIENTRIETQIKDFHRVEEWATDPTLDATKSALRIAAIHQLRPYLEGAHGETFRRPAYEIYRALLNGWKKLERNDEGYLSNEAIIELKNLPLPAHIEAIHTVIREILQTKGAWERVFPNETLPLRQLNLMCARLGRVHLEGADLTSAHLEGANFYHSHLENVTLKWAHMENAKLAETHMEGAQLYSTWLTEHTYLSSVVYSNDTVWDVSYADKRGLGEVLYLPDEKGDRFIHIDEWNRQQEEFKKRSFS